MTTAVLSLLAVAVTLSWRLSRRRPEYQPVAALVGVGLAVDLCQWALDEAVLAPLRAEFGASAPWTGAARMVGVAADGLALAWPASILAAAVAAFAGRQRAWAAAGWWVVALAATALAHPVGEDQDRALGVARGCAVVASVAVAGYRLIRERAPLDGAQATLVMILAAEVVSLFGAWRPGVSTHWPTAQVLYAVLLSAVAANQGRVLWKLRSSP